jgi:hypothetical protein
MPTQRRATACALKAVDLPVALGLPAPRLHLLDEPPTGLSPDDTDLVTTLAVTPSRNLKLLS